MKQRVGSVGLLLAMSGCAALVLQIGWLREFRLVFGSTTAASAAVLAIFMAGIGLGNAVLGRRADRHPNPLRLYGLLLLGVAVSSAVSPWLIDLTRGWYVALGGQSRLGSFGAAGVRLTFSAAAIGLPTFLMGGTLPAAARAALGRADRQRRGVGRLYGWNELGAVLGAGGSTLWLLESYGTRCTLLAAAAIDLAAGLLALAIAARIATTSAEKAALDSRTSPNEQAPANGPTPALAAGAEFLSPPSRVPAAAHAWVLYLTAGTLGFAFFLMEIVWYRMLAPLMGGSVYTFGLILTVVLAGIGFGGWSFAWLPRRWRPDWMTLALTVALEALTLAVPFALGDGLAMLAVTAGELKGFGFLGAVSAWTAIAASLVFPAAVVSGFQFPLLIALLGQGEREVGRQVGNAFAWNTLGGIAGSLAGGFGLLPWLTAIGAWRLVVVLLVSLSMLLLVVAAGERARGRARKSFWPPLAWAACAPIALLAIGAVGPTAVWRHGGIGAGRFVLVDSSPNRLHDLLNSIRRATLWEADGVESCVALFADNGMAFYVNGKSDGNAVVDAGTQIMLPLIGALIHPQPRSALVVGLGTGESAGWLADVDSVERLTVVELEPAMARVARDCAAANRQVLDNAKVTIAYDDAREFLLTSPTRYDLIVSEPSNPYRAGVATLFTREFYASVAQRLDAGGLFLQWMQTYETDARSIRTVMATLASVFPHIELWQTGPGDVVFVCSLDRIETAADALRAKIAREPFRQALADAWHAGDLEAVLARYLAGRKLVDAVLAAQVASTGTVVPINTDDRNLLEYGLARTLGRRNLFSMRDLKEVTIRLGDDRPHIGGDVDWQQVIGERLVLWTTSGEEIPSQLTVDPDQQLRQTALDHYLAGRMNEAAGAWESLPTAAGLAEQRLLAHAYAEQGSFLAELRIARLSLSRPTDAEFLSAILAARSGRPDMATRRLVSAFERARSDPWSDYFVAAGLNLALELSRDDVERARILRKALEAPFAVRLLDSQRLATKMAIAEPLESEIQVQDFLDYEPHVPWTLGFLQARSRVYAATRNRLAAQADRDLKAFERAADDTTLLPASPAGQ